MLRFALGPVILVVLFATTDVTALKAAFVRTRVDLVVWAYIVVVPTVLLRVLRWRLLLGPRHRPSRFGALVHAYAYAIFVGVVTPGRLGEFVKIAHVTRWGAPWSVAFMKVFVDRLFDVACLFAVALMGVWILGGAGIDRDEFFVATMGLAGVGVGVIVWLGCDVARRGPLTRTLSRWIPARLRDPLAELRAELANSSWRTRVRVHGTATVLTLAAWAVTYLAQYWLALALGFELGYLEVAGIGAISSLVTLVPITMLGAGTRDAAVVVLLAAMGYDRAEALAFSTLLLSLIVWLGIMCAPAAWMSSHGHDRGDAPST